MLGRAAWPCAGAAACAHAWARGSSQQAGSLLHARIAPRRPRRRTARPPGPTHNRPSAAPRGRRLRTAVMDAGTSAAQELVLVSDQARDQERRLQHVQAAAGALAAGMGAAVGGGLPAGFC